MDYYTKYLKYKKKYLTLKNNKNNKSNKNIYKSLNLYGGVDWREVGELDKEIKVKFKKKAITDYHHIKINNLIKSKSLKDIMQNINTLKTIWYSQDFNIEKKLKLVDHSIISGLANTNYWEKIITNVLLIINEKLPSDAIKSLVVGPSILECASILMLTLYLYILNNYGDDNFNLIFSKPALKFILQNSFISPLEPVERSEITIGLGNPLHFLFDVIEPKYENLQDNDFVYIEGVQEYKYKHLVGDFIGYNLLCVKNEDDINPIKKIV